MSEQSDGGNFSHIRRRLPLWKFPGTWTRTTTTAASQSECPARLLIPSPILRAWPPHDTPERLLTMD